MKITQFKNIYTLPFRFDIPNSTDLFLKKKSFLSLSIKFIKRYLYIKFKRQTLLEFDNILPEHQNILWINISAPSLGDSLMDLSSRAMLYDRKIDLFTDEYNAILYQNDIFFSSIFCEIKQMEKKIYDLVIIDSYSTRSIRIKAQIACFVPFVTMFGFYNGPEVNRVLFSFHKMNSLLGYEKKKSEISRIAKPSIFISTNDYELIRSYNLPQDFIAIVVGGEWSFRTFNKWDLVIEKLISLYSNLKVILIGSDNGIEAAKLIIDKFSNVKILNYVSKFTFNQTAEIINRCSELQIIIGSEILSNPSKRRSVS